MDFENFINKESKHHKKIVMQSYSSKDSYKKKSYSSSNASFNPMMLVESLLKNKKLKYVLVGILIFVIALVIGIIALVFPFIEAIINFTLQNIV